MKRTVVSVLIVAAVVLMAPGPTRSSQEKAKKAKSKVFVGEIYDSACAAKGTHEAMAPMMGVKADDHKQCTLKCVDIGAKFVLLDAAKKVVYELDDQQKPKEFAGEKVKVTGTLAADSKTIHVEKIAATK